MWTRLELKTNAKMALSRGYWVSFAICLVASLLGAATPGPQLNMRFNTSNQGVQYNWNYGYQGGSYYHGGNPFGFIITSTLLIIALAAMMLGIAYVLFVASPLRVGKSRYFITARNSHNDFGLLFSAFERGSYLNVVKTMFFTNLSIFLWSLLFVIPGIFKSYSYRMVPCILAENPNLDPRRAMELSTAMMDGERLNAFVLDLSFIGWYIAGSLLCGIGIWFVLPYVEATEIELYGVLRYKALQLGLCHPTELGEY